MRWVLAVLLAAVATLAPSPAIASGLDTSVDTTGNHITRWDETFDLQPDGSAKVTVEIDFNFGNDPGHGPYFTFPTRQGFDEQNNRVYAITDVQRRAPRVPLPMSTSKTATTGSWCAWATRTLATSAANRRTS